MNSQHVARAFVEVLFCVSKKNFEKWNFHLNTSINIINTSRGMRFFCVHIPYFSPQQHTDTDGKELLLFHNIFLRSLIPPNPNTYIQHVFSLCVIWNFGLEKIEFMLLLFPFCLLFYLQAQKLAYLRSLAKFEFLIEYFLP